MTDAARPSARQIVATLSLPLLILDGNLKIRDANPEFVHTFSVPPEEAIGTPLYEMGDGHFDTSPLRTALERLVEHGEPFERVELDRSVDEQDSEFFQVRGRRMITNEGPSDHILLAMREVTERKRLEEKRRRHAEQLERSNRDLEEFARVASHDLQEPLRMVSSYLQLLDRQYEEHLPDKAQEFIAYAVDGANRMKALINGLLQYSRVGRKEGQFKTVNLNELLDGVLRDLSRRIEEQNGTVRRTTLPTTFGNPDQLRRVFQNLIENALVYSGDAPPRISVEGEEDDDGVHLIVRDEGLGIPEDGRKKIFRIFSQVDPHGTGTDGSGMGLALCKRIVERHDGQIWVDSEVGEGSAFHFTCHLSPHAVS